MLTSMSHHHLGAYLPYEHLPAALLRASHGAFAGAAPPFIAVQMASECGVWPNVMARWRLHVAAVDGSRLGSPGEIDPASVAFDLVSDGEGADRRACGQRSALFNAVLGDNSCAADGDRGEGETKQ